MNESSSPFFTKIVVIVCFVIGIIGIAVFAASNFSSNDGDPNLQGTVVVWGTLPESDMTKIFYEYSQLEKNITVKYTQVPENIFVDKFIENVAKDTAPDMILAGENISFPLRNYFYAFGAEQGMSEATYKSLYARSTYGLHSSNGVFALPVAIDPLVMYVNTDILQNAGFTVAPKTWSDIPIFVKQVLELNTRNKNVEQRALALGSFSNILYAKEIILTLLLQLNNNVLLRTFEISESGGKTEMIEKYESVFGVKDLRRNLSNQSSAELVFNFFASFINPNFENAYTWSKKAPVDRDLFAAGNLGLYFGLASDKQYIEAKNPHLRYELALLPIPDADSNSFFNTSYGKIYSVSITTKTKNVILSQKVMTDITAQEIASKIIAKFNLAPARQDLFTQQTTPDAAVIYKSAERVSFVPEPRAGLLFTVFSQISEALNGSRLTPAEVISNAQEELARQVKDL